MMSSGTDRDGRMRLGVAMVESIKEMGLLLAVVLMSAGLVNAVSPTGIAWVGQWDAAVGVVSARGSDPLETGREIRDPAVAKAIYDQGRALFVDARSEADFAAGHIKGAVSLPAGRFEELLDDFISRYDMDQPIVTYCSGRTCEDSLHLALFLSEIGYSDVRLMIDGFPAWLAKGYPVEP